MFILDTYTIVGSAILLFVALLTSFINPFFRKPKVSKPFGNDIAHDFHEENIENETEIENREIEIENIEAETENIEAQKNTKNLENSTDSANVKVQNATPTPPISLIFTPNDRAAAFSKNIEKYLNQDYPNYEIIVVVPQDDTETQDILKTYANNPRLYTTFIPTSSKYMSRKKLAITLGVKAAKYDWLLMCDIFCAPQSDQWLATLARNCTDDVNLVAGYTTYEEGTSDFWRFEHFLTSCYLMRAAQRGIAYRWNSKTLLFKKDDFIKAEGFRSNLKYIRGEYDFLVNKYAAKHSTIVENSWSGTLVEEEPIYKHWINNHLFYMENRKHLSRNFAHRALFNLDQIALHLNYLMILAGLVYSILTQNLILIIAASLALILTLSIRIAIGKKALTTFNEEIPSWKIIPFELRIIWQNLGYKIKYWRADKYDFISHKL